MENRHDNLNLFPCDRYGTDGVDVAHVHTRQRYRARCECRPKGGHSIGRDADGRDYALCLLSFHRLRLATQESPDAWDAKSGNGCHSERAEQHVQREHAKGGQRSRWPTDQDDDDPNDHRHPGRSRHVRRCKCPRRTFVAHWLSESSEQRDWRHGRDGRVVTVCYSTPIEFLTVLEHHGDVQDILRHCALGERAPAFRIRSLGNDTVECLETYTSSLSEVAYEG